MEWGMSAAKDKKYRQQKRKKCSSVKAKTKDQVKESEGARGSRGVVSVNQSAPRKHPPLDYHAQSPPTHPHQRWLSTDFKLAASALVKDKIKVIR